MQPEHKNDPSPESYNPWNQAGPLRQVSTQPPAKNLNEEQFQKGFNSYRVAGLLSGAAGIASFFILWHFNIIAIYAAIFGLLAIAFGNSAKPKSIISIILGIVVLILNIGASLLVITAKFSQ